MIINPKSNIYTKQRKIKATKDKKFVAPIVAPNYNNSLALFMANTNTGVVFVLKNPKNASSPIKAIFTYNHNRFYYYEKKLSIETKFWNKNTQRAKENKSFGGFSELNTTLDAIENSIISCYRKYRNENAKDPSIDEFRDLVKIDRGTIQKQESRILEMADFIAEFIQEAKDGKYINLNHGKPVTAVTIRTYEQTYFLLKQFFDYQYNLKRFTFEHISPKFYQEFNYYLSSVYKSKQTEKSLSINTIGKHLTNIKTFMAVALERKLTTNETTKSKKFKVIREDVEDIYLRDEELDEIYNLDLGDNKRLEKVRDLFIIDCYCALRIGDLKRLNQSNIYNEHGTTYIEIEQSKTQNKISIPILPKAKLLMDKYFHQTGDYFPKPISEQKMNEYIKELAAQCPLLQQDFMINKTIEGKRVVETYKKWQLITNHTARRTFATNAVLKGIPKHIVMSITGHKTEKSFNRYLKMDQKESAKLFVVEMNKFHTLKAV